MLILGQVERAHKMYATGDLIVSGQQFNAGDWGPTTAGFMDYISNDLSENNWTSIYISLSSFSIQAAKEEALRNGAAREPRARVPLPPSDPPSPPHDD